MSKYEKIFWLEDMPDFLERYFHKAAETELKRDDLFSRVTWSHDFEEGSRKINDYFDLFILDADFPDVCKPMHRKNTESCLNLIKNNKWGSGEILKYVGDTKTNNFARFYRQFLTKNKSRVVVLSMSSLAPIVAFALGLPFYCKGGLDEKECQDDAKLWKDHIKRETELKDEELDKICAKVQVDRKSLDLSLLEKYECGSGIDFIRNYLL